MQLAQWNEKTKLVSAVLVSWGCSWAGGWEAVPGQHSGRAGLGALLELWGVAEVLLGVLPFRDDELKTLNKNCGKKTLKTCFV